MATPLEIADALEPEFRTAFLQMIEVIKKAVNPMELEAALSSDLPIPAVIQLFERAVGRSLQLATGGSLQLVYDETVRRSFLDAAFNLRSELVLETTRNAAFRVVQNVARDAIGAIRAFLVAGYIAGVHPRNAAMMIRDVVGLLPQHAEAVGRFTQNLVSQGQPPELIEQLARNYEARLIAYRANNIARTESAAAAHNGRYVAWMEQAREGFLQRERTWVEWVVTDDDRLCPWCAPMDGKRVRMGDLFVATVKGFPEGKPEARGPGSEKYDRTSLRPDPRSRLRDERGRFVSLAKRDTRDHLDGRTIPLRSPIAVLHPPLHPSCRCDLVLRFDD